MQEELMYGCDEWHEQYDEICCDNAQYAESWGFLNIVDLWSQVDQDVVTTFYDSSCNIPLFRAPTDRTFEEWQNESNAHGWPSFRDQEVVWDNVIVKDDGEVVSKCSTHLGHNLPLDGENRYCIDLMCIAGLESKNSDACPTEDDFSLVLSTM
eukprot:UN18232